MRARTIAFLTLLATGPGAAQPLMRTWTARWISVPDAPPFDYGVYHFRKTFELPERPATFLVHVTADNRYQLFANGERVAWGPARGDLYHWRYETVDLAPYLEAGRNVLAAVVWNFGVHAPQAQVTHQTGFLLQGDGAAEKAVSTDRSWKAARNTAYAPVPVLPEEVHRQYYVAGPGDRVDGNAYPWGWEEPPVRRLGLGKRADRSARQLTGRRRRAEPLDARPALDPAHGGAAVALRARAARQRSDHARWLPAGGRVVDGTAAVEGRGPARPGLPDDRLSGADGERGPRRHPDRALRGGALRARPPPQGEPRRGRGQGVPRRARRVRGGRESGGNSGRCGGGRTGTSSSRSRPPIFHSPSTT